MKTDYDIIIAGMGGAGMLLAWELTQAPELNLSILLIDKTPKTDNDRTWSFWTKESHTLEDVITRKWDELTFKAPTFNKVLLTYPYSYQTLRSQDLYQKVNRAIETDNRFTVHYDEITEISDKGQEVEVKTTMASFKAKHVYDSLFTHKFIEETASKDILLWQHFKGWFLETEEAVFNPNVPTLFDFTIPQEGKVQFMYILPFSTTQALVEYTLFSDSLLPKEQYEMALQEYVATLTQQPYTITEKEFGVIPMTNASFSSSNGNRVHYIGTKGGMCKASTGYAFKRMFLDAKHIVEGLKQGKQLRYTAHKRFEMYDSIILDQMLKHGGNIAYFFSLMFKKVGMKGMLTFLDEQTNFFQELQVMASVPPAPFLKSFTSMMLNRYK